MNCCCLDPVVIINRSRHTNRVLRSTDWHTIIRGKESHCVPTPKKARITHDDLDECYYYNDRTGEVIPIYLEVPCNKCIICKDKKAVSWATRVTCEANYHANCPWWITLTYNDYNKPSDGIVKRDLQLFFKRLRERVERQLNIECKLRYVAVGEYGGNTARPHYHMELFGLPMMSAKEVLKLLEQAWSYRVSYKRFRQVIDDRGDDALHYVFIRYDKNGKPLYYLRHGFVYVKPAHDNTPMYLAKYMFKPEDNTPKGKNPNFTLSSRKNGIGYPYIVDYADYHRNNPNITKIEFLNKHTGKLCKFGIPQYYKDYWFPTPSKIIHNEVKKDYDRFSEILPTYYEIMKQLTNEGVNLVTDVEDLIRDLNNKFPFWKPITVPPDTSSARHALANDYILDYSSSVRVPSERVAIYIFGVKRLIPKFETVYDCDYVEYLYQNHWKLYKELDAIYSRLMILDFDPDDLESLFILRDKYKASLSRYMVSQPEQDVKHVKRVLEKYYNKLKDKDFY